MIKKFLSIVIIFSMILHCSSRLGLLSFAYKNRFEIIEALNLTQEKHIATCDSHYFNDTDLRIVDATAKAGVPLNFSMAQEINLFQAGNNSIQLNLPTSEPVVTNFPMLSNLVSTHQEAIFHPPLA